MGEFQFRNGNERNGIQMVKWGNECVCVASKPKIEKSERAKRSVEHLKK